MPQTRAIDPAFDPAPQPDRARRILTRPDMAWLCPWGCRGFGPMLQLQQRLRHERREARRPDLWLAGEHPTVITQGVRGRAEDLARRPPWPVFQIDRGGMTTIHNPGQLLIYPIAGVHKGLLAQARFSRMLLSSVAGWLHQLTGLQFEIPRRRPGLFHEGRKVAAIGVSIRGGVTMHGIAINCNNDLGPWRTIIPCGEPRTRPATLAQLLGRDVPPGDLLGGLSDYLVRWWGYERVRHVEPIPGTME